MYERYFGFSSRPFDLVPDPRFLFWTAEHREVLCHLTYGITGRKGITLLIGEAGMGKTTLVRSALEWLEANGRASGGAVVVNNPRLTRDEFIEYLATAFGLSDQARTSKARFLVELTGRLTERQAAGAVSALIVDEAQALPDELLEETRLLANIETGTEKLLPLVLVGQPSLGDRLNTPTMRQLKQRVALRCALHPLDEALTVAYVESRIRTAGGDATKVFTPAALRAIYAASAGVPRTINVLCDNALVNAFAAQEQPIGEQLIREVCNDLDFTLPPRERQTDTGQPTPPWRPSETQFAVGSANRGGRIAAPARGPVR